MLRAAATAVATVLISCVFTPALMARPPVFTDTTYEDGLAKSKAEQKVFILDAMTSWCGPCKTMDKITWVDPQVEAWLKENAIAVQLDMDHHRDVSKTLAIHAYPTIVAFKDGKEFDRIIGLRNAEQFLAWLKGVKEGKSAVEQLLIDVKAERERVKADPHAPVNYARRANLAEGLLEYSQLDEAQTEYEWLWTNMPAKTPEQRAERRHLLVGGMGSVAHRSDKAADAFRQYRDEAAKGAMRPTASRDAEDLSDWVALNGVIDDNAATVEWASSMEKTPENVAALRQMGHVLFPMLVEKDRWDVAGIVIEDPAAEIERDGSQLGAYDKGFPSDENGEKPKSLPMMPTKPSGGEPAKKAEPKTMPAIPLLTKPEAKKDAPKPEAKPDGKEPKVQPAIPLINTGKPWDNKDPESVAKEVRRRLTMQMQEKAGKYYAACLAAGRADEAHRVAEAALKYADSPETRLALVETAVVAGQVSADTANQQRWLKEAEAAGQDTADLRAKWETAQRS